MNKFKPGDKVRCVDTTGLLDREYLKSGQIYTVVEPEHRYHHADVYVEGDPTGWWDNRFELIETLTDSYELTRARDLLASTEAQVASLIKQRDEAFERLDYVQTSLDLAREELRITRAELKRVKNASPKNLAQVFLRMAEELEGGE